MHVRLIHITEPTDSTISRRQRLHCLHIQLHAGTSLLPFKLNQLGDLLFERYQAVEKHPRQHGGNQDERIFSQKGTLNQNSSSSNDSDSVLANGLRRSSLVAIALISVILADPGYSKTLTGTVRDFNFYGTTHNGVQGHPDFQRYMGSDRGLVNALLGPDNKLASPAVV